MIKILDISHKNHLFFTLRVSQWGKGRISSVYWLHEYDNIDSMQLIQYGDRITEWRETRGILIGVLLLPFSSSSSSSSKDHWKQWPRNPHSKHSHGSPPQAWPQSHGQSPSQQGHQMACQTSQSQALSCCLGNHNPEGSAREQVQRTRPAQGSILAGAGSS